MNLKNILSLYLITISSLSSEVTITAHPDYPPVVWESGGTLKGASIEMVKLALKNLGHKAVLVPLDSWGRAQHEVKSGRVDILLPPYKTPEREKYYSFPKEAFLMDKTVILTLKGKVINFKEYKDLKKFDGIAIVNDSFGKAFDSADKKYGILKRFSQTKQCLDFLIRGRADYLIAGKNAVLAVVNKLGLQDKFDIQEQVIVESGMYTAISKKSKINTKKFRESFFNEMRKLSNGKFHNKAILEALKEYSKEKKEKLWL